MINPSKITNYNLTNRELEEVLLFWVCAAGKNGTTAARCLNKLLNILGSEFWGPMAAIYYYNLSDRDLPELMKECGIGCYSHKARTFTELANKVVWGELNLRSCTAEDLEKIYGIGMKTSRCFLIHSRKHVEYAGLDTHMLKNLRAHGVQAVPKTTPASKKQYRRLELEVLKLSKEAGMTPANYDLMVWNKYAVK